MKNFIFEFIKLLVSQNIDFVICGGIACILQGCERTTLDLDINVNLIEKNIEKLITPLRLKDQDDINTLERLLNDKK